MSTTVASVRSPSFIHLLAHDLRWQLVTALARSDRQVRELLRLVDQPANLVSYHLKRLRLAGLVTERRSSADKRDVYYSLDLDRLHEMYIETGKALHPNLLRSVSDFKEHATVSTAPPTRILFLCTHNSARSQMAEAIMRQLGASQVEVFSAGSEPSEVNPEAIRALARLGIASDGHWSKNLDEYRDQHFDYIITVCDRVRETCPVFPDDPERIHWSFPDPALVESDGARQSAFSQTALQLMNRIRYLVTLIERERSQ